MYLTNRELKPLIIRYQAARQQRDKWQARQAQLIRSTARRLRRRIKAGGNPDDINLARAAAHLSRWQPILDSLEHEIAQVAYAISERYMPRFVQSREFIDDNTRDDLIQAGVIQVLNVVHRFDTSRNTAPFSWLTEVVKNRWRMELRRTNGQQANFVKWCIARQPDKHRGLGILRAG